MEHLFQSWPAFSADIKTASRVLLLSDYDGTLTPIVGNPKDAVLSPEVREKLRALAEKPAVSVGIVSGRLLSELKTLVGIDTLYYAGNHGLEIEGPGLSFIHEAARQSQAEMKDLVGQFAVKLGDIDGVFIENKILSLSVHYRLVKESRRAEVTEIFDRITSPLLREGRIRVSSGKMVCEVRPPVDWHKGKAVETIKTEIEAALGGGESLPIYLGDDTTDEDAFKVIRRPLGWSIFIGPENHSSNADYYLDSPAEVAVFLSRLLELE